MLRLLNGGLDLAALTLFPGARVWWHCEYDDAPARILAHHWPGRTSARQFAVYDHDSHSWRMWPAIGLWGSIEYSETWPKTGMHVRWTSV